MSGMNMFGRTATEELAIAKKENKRLREALTLVRAMIKEGGVPRYTVTPGAGLNALVEEVLDPILKDIDK